MGMRPFGWRISWFKQLVIIMSFYYKLSEILSSLAGTRIISQLIDFLNVIENFKSRKYVSDCYTRRPNRLDTIRN